MIPEFEKYLSEKQFAKKFVECNSIDEQIEFCRKFLMKHDAYVSNPVDVYTTQLTQLPHHSHPISSDSFNAHSHMTTAKVDMVYFNRSVDEHEIKSYPGIEMDIKSEMVYELALKLCKDGYVKFENNKNFISGQTIFTARIGVVKP